MKYRWDNKYLHWGVTAFLVIAASMLFYYGIFHMRSLIYGIQTLVRILAPIIYGFIIAYILSPIVNFLEKKVIYPILKKREITPEKRGRRAIRWACVLISLFLFLYLIYALIMMILPQLIRSIMNIIYSFPTYANVVENWLNSFVERGWNLDTNTLEMLDTYTSQVQEYLTNNLLPQMQDMLQNISSGVFDILIFLKNFIIGAVISIYIVADKEGFVARAKMILYAVFKPKVANITIHAMRFTHEVFGGFFSGKILDSAIIGVLCYIGITILDMPYPILISVVIGVTNVIPFFGPYIGAIPCALLILLVDPLKGIYFILFILVLQQFDGNILGPKILGDSTGLSSFMVIVAIMIGGGLFGVPGMLVGVPVFAVIYAAGSNFLHHSLSKREMPDSTEVYYNIDCLDEKTREPLPIQKEHKRHLDKSSRNPNSLFMRIYNKLAAIILKILHWLKDKLMELYRKFKK